MRTSSSQPAPIETQASHAYRPTDKRIAELAEQWAFALANMKGRAADTAEALKSVRLVIRSALIVIKVRAHPLPTRLQRWAGECSARSEGAPIAILQREVRRAAEISKRQEDIALEHHLLDRLFDSWFRWPAKG